MVAPQSKIDMGVLRNMMDYFGDALGICERLGLVSLMEFAQNYDEKIIAQFFSTVVFHGPEKKDITWMTRDKQLSSSWFEFAQVLGYEENVGFKIHLDDGRPMATERMAPLYITGWGNPGLSNHPLPTYDIMRRIYFETLCPKSGNYDQIHAYNIDLLVETHWRRNNNEKLDVMHYLYEETWSAILLKCSAIYAPYFQRLINRKWHHLTGTRLEDFWQPTQHKAKSIHVLKHKLPRTQQEREVAEAEAAEEKRKKK
jgi:hypothetical protein